MARIDQGGTAQREAGSEPTSGAQGAGALSDVGTLRARAQRSLDEGAVTPGYDLDPVQVVRVLNEALATEIVCFLRYRRHYFTADGLNAESVRAEFMEHATEELMHADWIAERITQLGGEPDFAPDRLTARSHAEYTDGTDLRDMIRQNLIAERIAIESYREMIDWLGAHDPTSRRLLEQVLADEEEHADDMASLLRRMA